MSDSEVAETVLRAAVPDDDPAVRWQWPGDEELCWRHDRMHAPHPLSPITGDLGARAMEGGFNAAAAFFELPLRVRFARLLAHSYQAVIPQVGSAEEMLAGHRRAEEKLRGTMARLLDLWNGEWLPEIQEHLGFWDACALGQLSDGELAAHLEESERRFTRLWEIHFLLGIPFLLAPSLFDELYRELFPERDALEAYRLIEGFDNKTVQSERALWRLSRRALLSPEVLAVLAETGAERVPEELASRPETQAFSAELRGYLEGFGERSNEFMEFANPSWLEDPSPVIHSLRNYVNQPERDLEKEMAATAAERDRLVAEARGRLAGYPRPVAQQFEFLLKAAQGASFLHSEHAYWIDQKGMHRVRRLLLEAGRRLSERRLLDDPQEVFQLHCSEIAEGLRGGTGKDLRRLAASRREAAERYSAGVPPVLGRLPAGPPPDSPLHRAIAKFIGGPPQPPSEAGVLRGNPGSAGVALGPARVVRSLAEAGKLRPGDILVARTTAPPWTPLFATVAGVVTDAGGVLSHCSIVAREYRIPAVVGTGGATQMLRDGDLLEIDGAAGTVRILSP